MTHNKVYSLEDAFEIADELDSGNLHLDKHSPNDPYRQNDMFSGGSGFEDAMFDSQDSFDEMRRRMDKFQRYLMQIYAELKSIIMNEKSAIEDVQLNVDVLNEVDGLLEMQFSGTYKSFTYEQRFVSPEKKWEIDKQSVKLWLKAIILREYMKRNDGQL